MEGVILRVKNCARPMNSLGRDITPTFLLLLGFSSSRNCFFEGTQSSLACLTFI